jgi:uncharacterized protein (TIGR03435 family)
MAEFAQSMNQLMNTLLGRQVVDKTGLTGQYDFSMPMYPGYAPWMRKPPADDSSPDSTPSIFTVLQDSFGLKLEPTTAPVEFLVIDHMERPSEN